MKRASIGVSAHMGWAAIAVVASAKNRLHVVTTGRIETARPGDREALEPYHVAGGFDGLARVPRPPDPESALHRGLDEQRRFTSRSIARLADELSERGVRLVCAGLLTSRGRPAPSFEKAIGAHPPIHIQEGLAVRESIALALAKLDVQVREIDQKQLKSIASDELGDLNPAWTDQLADTSPDSGPWRSEERNAATAAWLALRRLR